MPIRPCPICGYPPHLDFRGNELPCPAEMAFGPYRSDDYKVPNKNRKQVKLTRNGRNVNKRRRQQEKGRS
jgi:hypothetical protein